MNPPANEPTAPETTSEAPRFTNTPRLRAMDGRIYRAVNLRHEVTEKDGELVPTGTVRYTVVRETPKLRGKAARRADKRARQEARDRLAWRQRRLTDALAERYTE